MRVPAAMPILLTGALLAACSQPAPTASVPTPARSATPVVEAEPAPVVVLDPGHNGANWQHPEVIDALVPAGGFDKPCNTTGTSTDAGYPEHEFTFDVATRAAQMLRDNGITVILTRSDDTGVGPCVDVRAAIANDAAADLAVSIHADGAAASARGFHVIEPGPAPDGGNVGILAASDRAARDLLTAFSAATGSARADYLGNLLEPGLTRRDDLAGLNLARTPAVMLESANMRNPDEALLVADPAWRDAAARGIADGVTAFLARERP